MFSIFRSDMGNISFLKFNWSANVEPFPALGRTVSLMAEAGGSSQGIPQDIGNRGSRP